MEPNGKPLAETIDLLAANGIRHHHADGPQMPDAAMHAFEWFQPLSAGRQSGFGPCPLSWSCIQAFFSLHQITPTPFELRLIRAFDRAFLTVYAPPEPKK